MPERVVTRFAPSIRVYIRDHVIMAIVAAIGLTVVLAILGNQHIWVGLVGAPAAIAIRGWYLINDEMAGVWELTTQAVNGPGERRVPLAQIETMRTLGSAAQIVTKGGDKHLLKYMSDPKEVARQIDQERGA